MSRSIVPTQPVPNQTLQCLLGQQACVINVYQTAYALFVDLYVSNELVVAGQIAENLNRLVRDAYLGFDGDLAFIDVEAAPGSEQDPIYTGLGTRFQLLYFEAQDVPED